MTTAAELHERVIRSDFPPYDPRLGVFMDERGYEAYKTNTGHTYYLYLSRLVRELHPKRVVELGTDIGRSAAFIMTTLPAEAEFLTVEIGSQPRKDLELFRDDPRLRIVQGSSIEPRVYQPVRDVDLLFIDTDHTYGQISEEWRIWRPRLSPNAVVVLDDIHLNEGMDRFWNGIEFPKVDAGSFFHLSGWGLFVP